MKNMRRDWSFWSAFVLAVALSLLVEAQGRAAPVPGRGDEATDPLPDGAVARLGTLRWRPGKDVHFLVCSPDGRLVASGVADGTVRVWDTATGRLVRTLWGHRQYVFAGCFSPDSKLLVSGGHDSIGPGEHGQEAIVWDAATGKALHRFSMPGNVVAAGFADKGKVVFAVSWQGTVCRWRVEGGKEIGRFRIDGWLNHPSLSPAGDLLAVEVRSRDRIRGQDKGSDRIRDRIRGQTL